MGEHILKRIITRPSDNLQIFSVISSDYLVFDHFAISFIVNM